MDTTTLDRLTAALRPDDAPDTYQEGWRVDSTEKAAWASRKLRDAHARLAELDAWEQRELDRVKAAAQAERERLQPDVDWFTGQLGAYLHQLVAEGRKTKSLDLPGGRIAIRARQPQLEVDRDQLVAWAREAHPDLVQTTYTVPLPAFKKLAQLADGGQVVDPDTGEVLPWATWQQLPDSATFAPVEVVS